MTTQYYEAVTEIPIDHCLRLQLSPEIPVGRVRVAITYVQVVPVEAAERTRSYTC